MGFQIQTSDIRSPPKKAPEKSVDCMVCREMQSKEDVANTSLTTNSAAI